MKLLNSLTITKTSAFLGSLLLVLSLFVHPAFAAADVTKDYDRDYSCIDLGGGAISCTKIHAVIVLTELPSGGWNSNAHINMCTNYIDASGNVLGENCQQFRAHTHSQDGVSVNEYNNYLQLVSSGGGHTCTFTARVHFAHDDFQINESSSVCS